MESALELTLTYNPNLVAQRQELGVSAEAVEVARRFPTSLNPSVSVDVTPWVFERAPSGEIERLHTFVTVAWAQPIELGHRTAHRESIARATYDQTRWNILQAELLALVQTYRGFQTATYRRQKLEVAERLVEFNRHLVEVLRRRMEAGQAAAADLVVAEVESQATGQLAGLARQEYAVALAELRQQIGIAQYADSAEPAGGLKAPQEETPGQEDRLLQTALQTRPEIRAAQAKAAASRAAVCLARADRIPIPSLGPMYERNETGATFYGLAFSTPVPILNAGQPQVRQREAEYHRDLVAVEQARQRVTVEIKATLARWRQAQQLVAQTQAVAQPIQAQAARMDRLFTAGQADILKLLVVQQRAIESQGTQLDAIWQATQAYADLLAALGATPLMAALPPPEQDR